MSFNKPALNPIDYNHDSKKNKGASRHAAVWGSKDADPAGSSRKLYYLNGDGVERELQTVDTSGSENIYYALIHNGQFITNKDNTSQSIDPYFKQDSSSEPVSFALYDVSRDGVIGDQILGTLRTAAQMRPIFEGEADGILIDNGTNLQEFLNSNNLIFANKADFVNGDAINGLKADFAEMASKKLLAATKANKAGAIGSAIYEILTDADYGQTPDGEGDFYVGGGNSFVARNVSKVLTVQQFGDDLKKAIEYHARVKRPLVMEADIQVPGVKSGSYVISRGYCNFDSQGHIIEDTTTYKDGEFGDLVVARAATDVVFKAITKSQKAIDVDGFIEDVGWKTFVTEEGCDNIEVVVNTDGGLVGYQPRRKTTDPASFKCRNIDAKITSKNTHYPYNPQFSGDNAKVLINAETCGRVYFIYGCSNVELFVISRNPQKTSIAGAFEGRGLSDVTIYETDLFSDNCQGAANHTTLRYGDEKPAEIKNVEFVFNLVNPAKSWGNSFEISKLDGVNPDSEPRGHKLIGLKVRGTINNDASGNSPITTNGDFATTTDPQKLSDIVDQIDVEHLTVTGGSSTLRFPALKKSATFKNVVAGSDNFFVITNNSSTTTFESVHAGNITSSVDDTSKHIYVGCSMSDGNTQNIDNNKTFIDTFVASKPYNIFVQNNIGLFTAQASTVLKGSLADETPVFRVGISPSGFKIRLKYHLVNNQADTNPSTRDETIGIKVLTATMVSNGAWAQQIAPANEVTEITKGTAANLSVNLLIGGIIAVQVQEYTQGNSRATLQIEVMSYTPTNVTPI